MSKVEERWNGNICDCCGKDIGRSGENLDAFISGAGGHSFYTCIGHTDSEIGLMMEEVRKAAIARRTSSQGESLNKSIANTDS